MDRVPTEGRAEASVRRRSQVGDSAAGISFDSEGSEAAERPLTSGYGSWRLGLNPAMAPGTGRSLDPTSTAASWQLERLTMKRPVSLQQALTVGATYGPSS